MPVATPPPQLWSTAVIAEPHPGRPVRLCADDRLRHGLLIRTLWQKGQPCGSPYDVRLNYRCSLNGHSFGVSTRLEGDPTRDLIVRSSVTDIDAERTIYSRALRLRLLGPCPAGWRVGEATDQQGRRRIAAVLTGTDQPAYPRP